MSTKASWEPHFEHGKPDTSYRKKLPDNVYAFPKKNNEPLTDADHVRDALARFDQIKFDQIKDVTDEKRQQFLLRNSLIFHLRSKIMYIHHSIRI